MLTTKTKSLVSQQPGQEHQQVLTNADAELLSLQSQIEQAQQAIVSARSELSALNAKDQARQTRLTTAQNNATQTKNALDEGTTRATLSQGTAAAGQVDTSGLKRQADRAQADLIKLQAQLDREAQSDNQRGFQVQITLDTQQQTLSALLHKQTLTRQIREQAQRDLGEAKMQICLEQLETLQTQIAEREQQLAQAKETLDQWGRQAVNALSEWPDLAATLFAQLPFDNPTTEILTNALELVTSLLEQGREIEMLSPHFFERAGFGRFVSIEGLLSMDSHMLWPALRKSHMDAPVTLQERQKDLERLLKAYIASKRGEA